MSQVKISRPAIALHGQVVRVARVSHDTAGGSLIEDVRHNGKVRPPMPEHDRNADRAVALHTGIAEERVIIELNPDEALTTAHELIAAALWALESR